MLDWVYGYRLVFWPGKSWTNSKDIHKNLGPSQFDPNTCQVRFGRMKKLTGNFLYPIQHNKWSCLFMPKLTQETRDGESCSTLYVMLPTISFWCGTKPSIIHSLFHLMSSFLWIKQQQKGSYGYRCIKLTFCVKYSIENKRRKKIIMWLSSQSWFWGVCFF